ncbi:MAG: hypothetical protein H6704_26995 [Myxococcales bacterium]|nr:hypothetical protein [Myxococcales bacterium]
MTTWALGSLPHLPARTGALLAGGAALLTIAALWGVRRDAGAPAAAEGPRADVYVMIEQGPLSPPDALAAQHLYAGDRLHVSVAADAESYLTLMYFDGDDHLRVSPRLRNESLPDIAAGWSAVFEVDDAPGEEQLVALVCRRPVEDVLGKVEAANAVGADRPARVAALRAGLGETLPASACTLRPSARFLHR